MGSDSGRSPAPLEQSPGNPASEDADNGEDTQQSTTLQNALQPLPDTQLSGQALSPSQLQHNRLSASPPANATVQLFSRSKQNGLENLDGGFKWGPPVKVKPGQFGRVKPTIATTSISIDPQMGQGTAAHLPEIQPVTPRIQLETSRNFMVDPQMSNEAVTAPVNRPSDRKATPPGTVMHQSRTGHPEAERVASKGIMPLREPQTRLVPEPQQQVTQEDPRPARTHPAKPPFDISSPGKSANRPMNAPEYLPGNTAAMSFSNASTPGSGSRSEQARFGMVRSNFAYQQSLPQTLNQVSDRSNGHQQPLPRKTDIQAARFNHEVVRKSLRNDISVPSGQPPRPLPRNSSPRSVTRGWTSNDRHQASQLSTPRARERSLSVNSSNTKAKRVSKPPVPSSSLRSSVSRSQHVRMQTPLHRRLASSQRRQQWDDKFGRLLGGAATCLNEQFNVLRGETESHLDRISELEASLAEHQEKASRYKMKAKKKDALIEQLHEEQGQLGSRLEVAERELQERSNKTSKLEEKCRSYKDFLNRAISEQQELYKSSKAKCEAAINHMQAEESKRQLLQEREHKHAEAARDQLKQVVKVTVTECKEKERELGEKIDLLKKAVEQREADLAQEKETNSLLLKQNASMANTFERLKGLEDSLRGVSDKVSEVAAQHTQPDDVVTRETHAKLDQVLEQLRAQGEQSYSRADVLQNLQELNKEAVSLLTDELDPIFQSQHEMKTRLDSLSENLGGYVDELWGALEAREDVLEEYKRQKEDEEVQRLLSSMEDKFKEKEEQCGEQSVLLGTLTKDLEDSRKTVQELEMMVQELEKNLDTSQNSTMQLEQLREEHTRLQTELAAKAAQVHDLQSQALESHAAAEAERQKHRENAESLRKGLDQRVVEIKAAQVKAVEAAQREAILQMTEVKTELEAQLKGEFDKRKKLQDELDKAMAKIGTMKGDNARDRETIDDLRDQIETCVKEAASSRTDATQHDAEKQRAIDEQSTLINNLQIQLAKSKERFDNLSQNAIEYDKAAQHILQSLKQWARKFDDLKQLANDFLSKKEDSAIKSQFTPLVDLKLILKAVMEYSETQRQAFTMLSGGNSNGTSQAVRRLSTIGNMLDRTRRVMVQSPSWNLESPKLPPSIESEQERRRAADPPRSIMKTSQQQTEPPADEVDKSVVQRQMAMFARGPYNRPVAGSKVRLSIFEEGRSAIDGGKKRRGTAEREMEAAKKKAKPTFKREQSILSTPRSSQLEAEAEGLPSQEAPRAPRKFDTASVICTEPPSSPVRLSQESQDSSQMNGHSSLKGRSTSTMRKKALNGSQDPLHLFYARREGSRTNDDSQGSVARSQDVAPMSRASQSLLSRFTIGR